MIFLGLGTNLGDREANLRQAMQLLNENGITVARQSSIYETAPRDVLNQPSFLNMVVECKSASSPAQLLAKVLSIEKQMGRDRGPLAIKGGPRLIDIDVLLFNSEAIETEELTVPHPRMMERRFVLEPLLEIAPDLTDLTSHLRAVSDQPVKRRTGTESQSPSAVNS